MTSEANFYKTPPVKSTQEIMRDARSDYDMANQSRYKRKRAGIVPSGSSADYHIRDSRYYGQIEDARELERNNPWVAIGIDRLTANVIMEGFGINPRANDKGLDRALVDMWEEWSTDADNCDLAGEKTWFDFECLAYRHAIVDGDCFVLPIDNGTLEFVEGYRAKTPRNTSKNVIHGVEVDQYRKPVAYWFAKDDIGITMTVGKVGDIRKVAARDDDGNRQVFHIVQRKQNSQSRGVTAFAASADKAGMLEDLDFANLVKAQVAACIGMIYEYQDGSAAGNLMKEVANDPIKRQQYFGALANMYPGQAYHGLPGQKLTPFVPNTPCAEYFEQAKFILGTVAVNMGLPLFIMLMDASSTNYSGFRGAFSEAKKGFRTQQKRIKERFHKPVFDFVIRFKSQRDAALRRAIESGKYDPRWVEFRSPVYESIDPIKDATAGTVLLETGQNSPRRICAGNHNIDFRELVDESNEDYEYKVKTACETVERIRKEFPDCDITWREIAKMGLPSGIKINLNTEETNTADQGKGEKGNGNPHENRSTSR